MASTPTKPAEPTAGSRKRSRFNFDNGGARGGGAAIDLSDDLTTVKGPAQPQQSLLRFGKPPAISPPKAPDNGSAHLPASVATAAAPQAEPPSKAARVLEEGSPSKRLTAKVDVVGRGAAPPAPAAATQISPKAPSPKAPSPKAPAATPGLPLAGVVMAFTGELDALSRADAEEKAKALGAKVMGSVSGNTTYLVMGSHLDDGRQVEETSKYRKYLELKEKGKKCPQLLREAELLALFPNAPQSAPAPAAPASVAPAVGGRAGAPAVAPRGGAIATEVAAAPLPGTSLATHQNWVDDHAPRSLADVLGNASAVRKLTEWLRDWDNVVLKGQTKKAPFKPGGGMPENLNARAALVSGPPGIGKTTTCRLVAKMMSGYDVLEYNASDARGQKIIQEMAAGIADNRTITFGGLGQQKAPALTKRACLIMDEVDGMGAGDRGGNAALIKMIKKTKNPIICICNDSHSPKIRSLAFSCYDLKFTKPTKTTIAVRCQQIAAREGLSIEPNALEELAESCGSDMRMVLNQLQMLAKSPLYKTVGVKYTDMKSLRGMSKDQGIMLTAFDAAKKLLNSTESSRMSFRDKMDMFFVDHSLTGLLVHENYLNAVKSKPVNMEVLNRCAYSADLMTVGDIINDRIRANQEWGLLPDVGLASCVYPAQVTNGFVAFPSFPAWLGKYSSQSRMRRLCTELQAHLRLSTTVGYKSLPTSGYIDLLYKRAMDPLMNGEINDTVGVLDAYGLRKEHLMEHLTELRQHLGEEDLFKTVDSKFKAALTREFNNGAHAMKVVIPSGGKKRKAGAVEEANPDEIAGDEERDKEAPDEEQEAEKSDDDVGGLVKRGGGGRGKAKAKAKAGAASSAEPSQPSQAKGRGRGRGRARP